MIEAVATPRISILPEAVRNRIAAGEVVERPASVARELIDNGIDAGATRIDVAIENGGARLVRVADDGCGMSAEDLPIAVQRYATSKITDADQIFGVRTMGFRGEALPSIGAVSELSITSMPRGGEAAARVTVKGGEIDGPRPAAAGPGTVVEVRNLFYNTPARRKFMKSARAEAGAVGECVTSLALARPDIAFRLAIDDKELFALPPAASLRERALALFGPELAGALMEGQSAAEDGLAVRVALAPPAMNRANRKGIYLFVDGRPVRDAGVFQAVLEGYRGLVMTRQFPQAFLFLACPPGAVDVNVHPQKAEVRFRDRDAVFSLVVHLIRATLARYDLAPRASGQWSVVSGQQGPGAGGQGAGAGVARRAPEAVSEPALAGTAPPALATDHRPLTTDARPVAFDLWRGEHPGPGRGARPRVPLAPAPAVESLGSRRDALGSYRYLGQVAESYLAVETTEGLRIVDPHALHERILFDRLEAKRGGRFGDVQRLLVPEAVELSPAEGLALEAVREELEAIGFEIEAFGPHSAAVRAAPAALARVRVADVIRELADRAERGGRAVRLREAALAVLACRAAVKFGDRLPDAEARALLDGWRDGLALDTCPHGRPTSVVITLGELERMFGRRR